MALGRMVVAAVKTDCARLARVNWRSVGFGLNFGVGSRTARWSRPEREASMSNDQRVYSDEEFALILRKAAELASRAESPGASSAGLTMTEMKSAASQAGLDPAFVERAARMLAVGATASPIERLIGGPLRHHDEARFPIRLDEKTAALLLSAVRISAGLAGGRDPGHSSSMGMTWHDGGDLESLRVTARPEEDGTAVSVVLDRRGTLTIVGMFSGMAMFLAALFATFALYPEAPALGVGGFIAGIGGVLAVARGYWASSTRKIRERIDVAMDAIDQTLTQAETQTSGFKKVGDGAVDPERDPTTVANTDAELTGA